MHKTRVDRVILNDAWVINLKKSIEENMLGIELNKENYDFIMTKLKSEIEEKKSQYEYSVRVMLTYSESANKKRKELEDLEKLQKSLTNPKKLQTKECFEPEC